MQRVVVLGCGGAGKTRFARALAQRIERLRREHGPGAPVVTLRTDREVAAFLAQAQRGP